MDVGWGNGRNSVAVAGRLGVDCRLYGMDLWEVFLVADVGGFVWVFRSALLLRV